MAVTYRVLDHGADPASPRCRYTLQVETDSYIYPSAAVMELASGLTYDEAFALLTEKRGW